ESENPQILHGGALRNSNVGSEPRTNSVSVRNADAIGRAVHSSEVEFIPILLRVRQALPPTIPGHHVPTGYPIRLRSCGAVRFRLHCLHRAETLEMASRPRLCA